LASVASGAETGGDYPIMKKGESLAGISGQHGISLAALREPNNLKKNRIHPNMRLRLTSHVAVSDKSAQPAIYHVIKKRPTGAAARAGHSLRAFKTVKATKHAAKRRASTGGRLRISRAKVRPSARG
jgi:LysM repeat protein